MAYKRYRLTESADGMTWAITDIFTDWPAIVRNIMMDGMDLEEAATVVDLMNALDCQKRVIYAVEGKSA